ncbi:MAG: hypothetical protein NC402_07485 [Prevotella sp.]|nr:hypothetical protein [Prevotella sp.]MCM1074234.1 hypothetical protein [Ruminococcus sp.]
MEKTTDIQRFKALFTLWLEGDTSREREKELLALAKTVNFANCDEQTRRDAKMVVDLESFSAPKAYPAEFNQFLENLTAAPTRKRKFNWLKVCSAAAAVALIAGAGIWLIKSPEKPAMQPEPATPQLAQVQPKPEKRIDIKPIVKKKAEAETVTLAPAAEKQPTMAVKSAKPKPAAEVAEPEVLQTREITDPEEAIALLTGTCELLASCAETAEQKSADALSILHENLNTLNNLVTI